MFFYDSRHWNMDAANFIFVVVRLNQMFTSHPIQVYKTAGKLTNQQITNLLSSQVVGRLACTDGQFPYIVPVHYSYDGKYIYGQTNDGEKLRILRKNPNVCFEIDRNTSLCDWQSIIVHGKYEELKGNEAIKAREILFNNAFFLMSCRSVHAHEHSVSATIDDSSRIKKIMYRISIDKVTGRFEKH